MYFFWYPHVILLLLSMTWCQPRMSALPARKCALAHLVAGIHAHNLWRIHSGKPSKPWEFDCSLFCDFVSIISFHLHESDMLFVIVQKCNKSRICGKPNAPFARLLTSSSKNATLMRCHLDLTTLYHGVEQLSSSVVLSSMLLVQHYRRFCDWRLQALRGMPCSWDQQVESIQGCYQ